MFGRSEDLPDLSELERRIAAWRPVAGGLSRERMLYEAGRGSAPRGGRVGWAVAAGLALASVGLGSAWQAERGGRARAESLLAAANRDGDARLAIARAPALPEPTEPGPLDPSSYLALSQRIETLSSAVGAPGVGESRGEGVAPDAGSLRVRGGDGALTL